MTTDLVPESVCVRIGHDAQASHIEADPELCPHFSDAGRRDIVRGLRFLSILDGVSADGADWETADPINGLVRCAEYARGLEIERDTLKHLLRSCREELHPPVPGETLALCRAIDEAIGPYRPMLRG